MENYLSYALTAIASFIVSYALKYVGPKSRLAWWNPHVFEYNLPNEIDKNGPPIKLLTQTITIQNLGSVPAKNIEIKHKTKPDHFKLIPALDYTEQENDHKEHTVKINFLGPKEFFNIEFLTYKQIAELLYIRSEWGHAQPISTQPVRVLHPVKQTIILFFLGMGIISTCFLLIKIWLYLWPNIIT